MLGLEKVIILGLAIMAEQTLNENIIGLELQNGRNLFLEKVLLHFILICNMLEIKKKKQQISNFIICFR
jgi:hypothetical protein